MDLAIAMDIPRPMLGFGIGFGFGLRGCAELAAFFGSTELVFVAIPIDEDEVIEAVEDWLLRDGIDVAVAVAVAARGGGCFWLRATVSNMRRLTTENNSSMSMGKPTFRRRESVWNVIECGMWERECGIWNREWNWEWNRE